MTGETTALYLLLFGVTVWAVLATIRWRQYRKWYRNLSAAFMRALFDRDMRPGVKGPHGDKGPTGVQGPDAPQMMKED